MNQIVIELKSEALKERHWKQMMKQLKVNWTLTDLTLGQVWDADLVRHEAAIKDIMLVAQGEMALEEFLKQVSRSSFQRRLRHCSLGARVMASVRDRVGQLSEQDETDQGMGGSVQQAQRTHQQSGRHETQPLLQGTSIIAAHIKRVTGCNPYQINSLTLLIEYFLLD
jgi:hypothetical protein